MRVGILLSGCDDSTWFVLDDVTEEQKALIDIMAAKSEQASTYGCMPRMSAHIDDDLKSEEEWRS